MTAPGATSPADDSDAMPASSRLDEARARLGRVDELPVAERAVVLSAVNELLLTELAAMDEG